MQNKNTDQGLVKIVGIFLLLSGLMFLGCSPKTEVFKMPGSSVEFVVAKESKPGVFATSSVGDISIEQVLSQNPVQTDLKNQEASIMIEHVLRKYLMDPNHANSDLEIYMAEPKRPLKDLAKSWGVDLNPKLKVSFKQSPPDKDVIARWGEMQITASEVQGASVRLSMLKMKAYRESLNRVRGVAVRRALHEAAKKDNQEIEQYIQTNILKSEVSFSDADFDKYLLQVNIKKADINSDTEKALRGIALENKKNAIIEEYVVSKLLNGRIELQVPPPQFTIALPDAWKSVWGYADAPISIVFFGDYTCGPCKEALQTIIKATDQFGGHLSVGFQFLFSDSNRESRMLSEAALCVQSQGKKFFREFSEQFVAADARIDESAIDGAVQKIGADFEAFRKCFMARDFQSQLSQQLQFATQMGVTSQPTMLIDGEPFEGVVSEMEMTDAIKRKIQAKSSWLSATIRKIKGVFSKE